MSQAAYSIEEHRHRFAAWGAASAARASPKCRFTVQSGIALLESIGFASNFSDPGGLPAPEKFDSQHAAWRKQLIDSARPLGIADFSHGVAAKLINAYLKVRFVCGGHHEHPNVANVHPPVDRLLLNELATGNIGGVAKQWQKYRDLGWSNFTAAEYEQVIKLIRESRPDRPLWEIEEWWKGHQ